jgi:hypothetical protein
VKEPGRYSDPSLFGGLEDVGSVRLVESDLSKPALLAFESSKFLGESWIGLDWIVLWVKVPR